MMLKEPIMNTPTKTTLFFFGRRIRNSSGTGKRLAYTFGIFGGTSLLLGMLNMIRSEEMLNTAFVIKWFVAALHCAISVNE
jgi:hypothetical protein